MTSMPLPSGTGWTVLCLATIVILVVLFFVVEAHSGEGGKLIRGYIKAILLYIIDAPFAYVKIAVGFAILKWLGWI